MDALKLTALLVGSYLLGSLPFGLWIAWRWRGVDIRTMGSGNIGSTNVGRVCGPIAGGLVFLLDVLKGLLPPLVLAALHFASPWQILAALLAILGHNYSVFLGFKGGKGIATSLGALLGIAPKVGLTAFALFGIEVLTVGYVSLGSILGALSLPVLMPLFYPGDDCRLAFGVAACLLALYKHRANIQRLRNRTEPKVRLPWRKSTLTPVPSPTLRERGEAQQGSSPSSTLQQKEKERDTPAPESPLSRSVGEGSGVRVDLPEKEPHAHASQ